MVKFFAVTGVIFLVFSSVYSQEIVKNSEFKSPGLTKAIFEPGLISNKNIYEFGSALTKGYNEIYFGVRLNQDWKAEIRYSEFKDKEWSAHKRLNLDTNYTYNDPFLNESENKLYFVSNMPLDGKGEPKDFDIWYMEKSENGWGKPINCGNTINSGKDEFYVSFSENGAVYFVSNSHTKGEGDRWDFDIYYSLFKDEKYQEPVRLNNIVNSTSFECDPFIAPDESYLIFCSSRPGGYGEGDLYICFKGNDGTWNEPINMGKKINTEYHEFCPQVTKDGKYFFYTSNGDIYFISTEILNEIKIKNIK